MTNNIILPNEEIRIEHGSQVSLHFELSLTNGTVIDSTFERAEPVSLVVGDGSLLEGFEKVLTGLKAGDTRTATLAPEQAFGIALEDNKQRFSRSQFSLSCPNPTVGMMMEFGDKGQNSLVGVISFVDEDTVIVNFNHPLANQEVLFKVQIHKVIPKNQSAVQLRSS